jgi:N-acetyl-anhydromuramyl-L-alanine amidase AmpD
MAFEIVADRLRIKKKAVPFVSAHASGGRMVPSLIVLHDTADRPAPKDTVNWFASAECKVSAHFVVERDGSIIQMVECDQKAFHAGKSTWKGRANCNGFAIGIEIDNPGKLDKNGRAWFHKGRDPGIPGIQPKTTKEHGAGHWLPYTPEQVAAVTKLCQALVKAYPGIKEVVTHYLISPGRKIDVNPLFPLDEVRAAVFSVAMPESDKIALGADGDDVKEAQQRLKSLGYPVGDIDGRFAAQMRAAVLAFEAENGRKTDGVLDYHDLTALYGANAKSMPHAHREEVTTADTQEAANAGAIEKAVGSTTLAGVGDKSIEIATGYSPITALLNYMDTAVNGLTKLSGLGVTLPPRIGATVVLVIVGYVVWRWARTIRWSQVLKRRLGFDLS